MPESFGSSTTAGYIYSIYATYTTEQEEAPELIGNPYMFTGRRFDIETGLYYYRARYYNPHIGRFMQTDLVGYNAGINWYLYCRNNPLNYVDPSGLIAIAFYDPTYEIYEETWYGGLETVDETDQMQEWADDFVDEDGNQWYFPMSSRQDVLEKLKKLQEDGVEITSVYFFDHSGFIDIVDIPIVYIAEFGDEEVLVTKIETFWKDLGEAVPVGCSFHFRGCLLGATVEKLAKLTGRTVTAVDGLIYGSNPYPNPNGPDYRFGGNLIVAWNAGPLGIVSCSIWTPLVPDPNNPNKMIPNPVHPY